MNIQYWIQQIDEITGDVNQSFGNLSADQLAWKPSSDRWSITQCLEHLITVNNSYFPMIKSVREGNYKAPWTARFGFITNLFGKMILSGVHPDRKRKTQTFSVWEPETGIPASEIIIKFTDHQQDLKKLIGESEDLLIKGTVISSPANRLIVYRLDKAFDIIVAHERRHIIQSKEVMQQMKK